MIVEHIHIETKKDLVEVIHSLSFIIELAHRALIQDDSHSRLITPSIMLLGDFIQVLDENTSDQDGKLENRFIRKEDAAMEFEVYSSLDEVKP